MRDRMRIALVTCLIWMLYAGKAQTNCPRTNRRASRMCARGCSPETGCDNPTDECLCDGDCGYSCVRKGLSCGKPPSVRKAQPQYQSTNFGAVVTYVCNTGYTLSGASQRTCRGIGKWDDVGPKCLAMCSTPVIPFSTYIAKPLNYSGRYSTGETITLACKKGFKEEPGGNPIRICISGRWTQFPFKCIGTHSCRRTIRPARTMCTQECSPESGCGSKRYSCLCDGRCGYSCIEKGMSCGEPLTIANGKLNYTGTGYNDTAHYTCDKGYSLNTDSPVKRCTAKKRWDGLPARCMQDCVKPEVPRNAIISNPSESYRSGDKVTFECKEGFNQEGIATQMCFQGQWTVLPFKCSEGGCGDPGTPKNGRSVGNIYSLNRKVYFRCDLGYELFGSEERKCQQNGTWTGQQPVCRVVDCGKPQQPKNGRYIGNLTIFQSSISYECDDGYVLQGSETRMCTSDKNWSGRDVTCSAVDCGRLLAPGNGSLLGEQTTFPNYVEIRCDDGFVLSGSHRRNCQANRTWSGSVASCAAVDCGPLSPPTNGSSFGKDTSFLNVIVFKCDAGFNLIGSSSRQCKADRTWSGAMPVCKAVDCGKLVPPMNASIKGEETTFPNQVEIRCDEGFILRGTNRRKCEADKTWSGGSTFCEAIDCGKPTVPDDGSVAGVSTRYPHTITFACAVGYENEGSSVRRCQANGTWSGIEAICKPVDCGPLEAPLNGTTVGEKTTYLSKITFHCDDGFDMTGSISRICRADKQWSGNEPFCSAKDCGPLDVPVNGTKSGNETTYPNEVIFSCDDGFNLRGSTKRMCTAEGIWSGVKTFCDAKDCGSIKVPLNGSLVGKSKTTFPNSITFQCDKGFVLKGSSVRQCQADGFWSGSETSCQAKDCGGLIAPINGTKKGRLTTYPNEVIFACDDGFHLSGSSRRQCTAEGVWSGVETICEAKDCGPIAKPLNGTKIGKQTTYPNEVIFSCDNGFLMRGSRRRRCTADGTWSGEGTTCKAKDCGPISAPLNGTRLGGQTTYPNEVIFSCDDGFHLRGSNRRTCTADGTWSGVEATCQAKDCGVLKVPLNGSLVGSNLTTFPNSLTFTCDEGFYLKGSPVRKCQANAVWSGSETFCQAKDCGPIGTPVNGTKLGSDTTFPNEITFYCDDGFNLRGSGKRICTTAGEWSGVATICEAKDCGSLKVPLNGSLVGLNVTSYPNSLTFSCDEGFILKGSRVRECQANAQWSGNVTFCEAKDCGHIGTPANGTKLGSQTTYPNEVIFSCDDGFHLRGSIRRRCTAGGAWSGVEANCEAKDCGSLKIPLNGSLTGPNITTFPNSLTFSCDRGFAMKGSRVRSCQANAIWSGNETLCQAKDCGRLDIPVNGSSSGGVTTYPSEVTFDCDDGFIILGPRIRKCLSSGLWSGNTTSCTARDCGPLLAPYNGSSIGRDTKFPNSISFYCDVGFIMIGSQTRRCKADGSWSGNATSCKAVECGPLAMPTNGSSYGELTTYPHKVYFQCDDGFTLKGSSFRTCTANGSWSGTDTFCEAVDCGPLPFLLNGSHAGNITTYPNEVTFNCDEGFLMKGSARRFCQANRTWSGTRTICEAVDCGVLFAPFNGSLHGSLTTFPNLVEFSCDEGFLLEGSYERRCQANATWSGQTTICRAKDCGNLSVPRNGTIIGNQTTYPNDLLFSCDDGFNLIGSTVRSCQADSEWSGNQTYCEAVDCGPLPELINGSYAGELTMYPNKVISSCEEGFLLRGSEIRFCQANASWSGINTICEAIDCGPLRVPFNGSSTGNLTVYPNEIQFYCDSGFFLDGASRRFCLSNGTWSGLETSCKPVDCGEVQAPENGSLRGNHTTFPNKLNFYCDEGFVLKGSSFRDCLSDATWSGNETTCQAKDCGRLDIPQNGSMAGKLTTFPNEVIFRCDDGFVMTGSVNRKCQAGGTWSGNVTLCSAIDCGPLMAPINGSISGDKTTYPNLLRFECDEGFTLNGFHERHCQANGKWSGNATFCQANDCGPLQAPMNGTLSGDRTTYPNKIKFNCDDGFILRGSTVRQCQSNKHWSGNYTFCEAVDCGPINAPTNGSVSGNKTVFPNSAQFGCDPGFILRGSNVRNCQANGTWDGIETLCNAIDCGPLRSPTNGSVFGLKTTYPNMLRFECEEGFTLNGSPVRNCRANGTWSGEDTFCQANDCGPLPVPVNGTLSGNATTYPHKISFNCDVGFILHGSSIRQCQPNQQWSGNGTFCEAVDCGAIDVPINGSLKGSKTVFPNSIQFACDSGFILRGSTVRTCQANGTWDGIETHCDAVDCGVIKPPLNGSVSGEMTVFPHLLRIYCDEGFTLLGSASRKCQANGTWSGTDALCKANDCGPLQIPSNGTLTGNLTTYPNKVIFTCNEGFILYGSSQRYCQSDRRWSGNETFCKARNCGPLPVPTNGSQEGSLTTFSNQILFRCEEGFILRGSESRICQANGSWSGNQTFCEAKNCGALQSPTNGSLLGNMTTYPHMVKLACNDGFNLRGSRVRQCLSHGNWSGSNTICEAKNCGPLSAPINGSLIGKKTSYPNKIKFACDDGFLLKGSKVRYCQANGTWNGADTSCEAVDCGPLSIPLNGSSSGNLTVYPNKLYFGCDPGFIQSGSPVRLCQSNGTWDGSTTYCEAVDCGKLHAPQNGTIIGGETTFPNIFRLSCDEGFFLKGSKLRKCQTNGTWSGNKTECRAEDCGQPQPLKNGSFIGEKTVYPNIMHLICDEGFILRGSSQIKCQTDGNWSNTSSFCDAKDCGQLAVPYNGSIIGNYTTFPNKFSFNCDEGYILHGSVERRCEANGSWSGIKTTCEARDCGPLPIPRNGSSVGKNTTFPNSIVFDCDDGFILLGSNIRNCQANGTWSGNQAFCEAKDCGSLSVPLNGSITGNETTFPNEVSFSCDEGFVLSGSPVRRCEAEGSWSGNQTRCEAVNCGPLTAPTNGSSSGDSTVFPNSVLFDCDPGFQLKGSFSRMCQTNGIWSGLPAICVARDCGPLAIPRNGSSLGNRTTFPNEIAFVCDDGFILVGSTIRVCHENGTWSGNQTFCKAVDCGPLFDPTNGSSSGESTLFPNSVLFNCDSGFLLRGSSLRMCQPNGTWSGLQANCIAKDCGPLSLPLNGSMTGNETTFPNEVSFSCDEGFVLHGSTVRWCQAEGSWSGNQTECEAVDCGPISVPMNGSFSGESTDFPNSMLFNCDPGFLLKGSSSRMCQPNGTWSGLPVICAARDCGHLPVPRNGSSSGNITTFPNEIGFVCDDGFILVGSKFRVCQENGLWSGNETFCEAVDCGPLLPPMNGTLSGDLTVFPNSVFFHCDPGFVLQGSSERACQANATWSGYSSVCEAVDCGALSFPLNGSSYGGSTTFPNSVHFSCDPGFILHGSSKRTCMATGSWSGIATTCAAVDCGQPQPLRNGSIVGVNTVFPSVMYLSCHEGFLLRGASQIQCEANGSWSKNSSFCEAVDCGSITIPKYAIPHGSSTKFPSIIKFSCQEGFYLQGSSSRKCQANGTWTSGVLRCYGADCGQLSPPENGWMSGSKTSYPHNVSFTCRSGFLLVGSSQRTCLRNGTWSGEEPTCLALWCSYVPKVPLHAYQTWGTDKLRHEHGENIYYSCIPGYIMQGTPKRQCVKGMWSPIKFRCSAPSCSAPGTPSLSYITAARGSLSKYLDGEKVYYSCRSGYQLAGIPEIECKNGVWTTHQFTCEPVSCGVLSSPTNGLTQRQSGTTFKSVYVFRCKRAQGYIMRGSAERKCLANATWSGEQPICYMQTCKAPPQPRYGKFTPDRLDSYQFANIVQYRCDYGFSVRGHKTTKCLIYGNWSNPAPKCISCSSPLGLKNRMIFNHQLTASSERDSRHGAKHGRLHGNSAWCSARSSLPKYFQIDFGHLAEVTAVATQGHPKEHKWVLTYVLKYSLGKHWHTYQESGIDKVFQGNRDRNTVVKHYLKEKLVAKRLRILRYQSSRDFEGSTACLRAEVYGCYFKSECLAVGSRVFARWNTINKHTRYFHGFITKIRKTSVEITPSGNYGARVNRIIELPRAEKRLVIIDKQSKPSEINLGADVIVASQDRIGFSQGQVTKRFGTWYGVDVGNRRMVWKKARDIRLLINPIYCDRE
ncbi:sushi, von Willebrand factor type A, EGF and pentraxin domain-containing protein 1-like isoform X2 [Acropora muricata]|uniref:sushi, von Willebrand factor type A, EGF and pentraxin domain-containing protein 1-like isoform X2 n=1 Tax=Acropora muricata TaxID=159855 RepID=UPI0034E445A8